MQEISLEMKNCKKIVVCPDSFKGSLSAREVVSTVAGIIREKLPDTKIIELPLADGGEGTAEIVSFYNYPEKISVNTVNAAGSNINVSYFTDSTGKKAFIESASIIGLPLIEKTERNPIETTSFGLGLVIRNAIERGCEHITVSLGGSATCDGGMGMLSALGYRFFDYDGGELYGKGGDLKEINRIEISHLYPRIRGIKFITVCDVRNPLTGEKGTAKIFAPQKGATIDDVEIIEKGLKNFVLKTFSKGIGKKSDAIKEGAGAAGGLGYAFYAYLHAENERGIDYILNTIEFDKKIIGSDLIITGEGKIDCQSLMGKVIEGVLNRANRVNIPVVAIGGMAEDRETLLKAGLKDIIVISNPKLSLDDNLNPETTIANIQKAINKLIYDLSFV